MEHWDESDQDIKLICDKINEELIIVNAQRRQLGIFRDAFFKLRKIEVKTSSPDGSVEVGYVSPKNVAQNDMEESQRTKLKTDLITNYNSYKNETTIIPPEEEE